MILKSRTVAPQSVLRLGFAFLLVTSIAHWFLLRPGRTPFESGVADGVYGALQGVTIGTFLVGLRMNRKRGA